MVLAELGVKLQDAVKRLNLVTVVDEDVLNAVLGDISRALLEADVNVRLVGQLRQSIKMRVNLEEEVAGTRSSVAPYISFDSARRDELTRRALPFE